MRRFSIVYPFIVMLLAATLPRAASPHGGAPPMHFAAPPHMAPAPAPHINPAPQHFAPVQRPAPTPQPTFHEAPNRPVEPRVIDIPHNAPARGPQPVAPGRGPQPVAPGHAPAVQPRVNPVAGHPVVGGAHPGPAIAPHPYAARPTFNNAGPVRRTEYRGGVGYVRTYRPYTWGGRPYFAYQPAYVYSPWYYGYCGRPWGTPVYYQWGWVGAPWYGYYGYYYNPYPVYAGPTFWLTDFLLADLLAEQYAADVAAANAEAAQAYSQPTPISDDVKEQIRAQVEADIQAQQNRQPRTIDTVVGDTQHIFAVSENLNVVNTATQQPCSLREGDLIRLTQAVPEGGAMGTATVVSSKNNSCPAGAQVDVSVHDLQTFENEFSARVDKGMQEMQKKLPDGSQAPQQ